MTRSFLISVQVYGGRYHGTGEWPPAPARLFQALVAGAGVSGPIEGAARDALEWLEHLEAPVIAVPRKRDGNTVTLYVPNNDLDSVGGDLRRIAEIRGSKKVFKPRLFEAAIPFMYGWSFVPTPESVKNATDLIVLVERLYQFGRGIDFACAWGELLETSALEERLLSYPGEVRRPSLRGSGLTLKCPTRGSLKSLDDRYSAFGQRFHIERRGRTFVQTLTKPPESRFVPTTYDSPVANYAFELRERSEEAPIASWPLSQIVKLVELLRDTAVTRLISAEPSQRADIEQTLVGHRPSDASNIPPAERVRILPLPSIGYYYADRDIRRVLIQVPPSCPLRADDIAWSFSGIEVPGPDSAEGVRILTPSSLDNAENMLAHYGIGCDEAYRLWRTITPTALPEPAARRRIDPGRRGQEAKLGSERVEEYTRAAGTVLQALRHARITVPVRHIRLQREPFESKGQRVETFANGTRFSKHRLWHVEIEFTNEISGPLVIGDGRFMGLGIMSPIRGRPSDRSECTHREVLG